MCLRRGLASTRCPRATGIRCWCSLCLKSGSFFVSRLDRYLSGRWFIAGVAPFRSTYPFKLFSMACAHRALEFEHALPASERASTAAPRPSWHRYLPAETTSRIRARTANSEPERPLQLLGTRAPIVMHNNAVAKSFDWAATSPDRGVELSRASQREL